MKTIKIMLFLLACPWLALAQAPSPPCSTTVSTFPYFQDFEGGAAGWFFGGTNSTWSLGTPGNKLEITTAASGINCWVTNLAGEHSSNENSFVYSPCFNLSSLVSPVIELKIWWNSEYGFDGTVLQSSINGGLTWQNVGRHGDPYNWFNVNNIGTAPGNQQGTMDGWSGREGSSPGNGSGGWVVARHKLDGLGGNANVRLRVAFASNSSYEDDGFAFDDVRVYETPLHDTGVLAIVAPNSNCGLSNQETVTVKIKNYGQNTQTSFPVSYKVGSNVTVTEIVSASLQAEDTLTYSFATKLNMTVPGAFSIKAFTGLAADGITANDTTKAVFHSIPTISNFPYSQNFENGNGGWLAAGTNSSWQLGTPAKFTINTAASGTNSWVTGLNGQHSNDENSAVTGPCFNFSTLTNPLLTMKVWWECEDGFDGAVLQSSVDGGLTWQKVGAMGDPDNWYNNNAIDTRPGGQSAPAHGWSGSNDNVPQSGSGGWVTAKHVLTGLGGQSNVKLRIAFSSNNFWSMDGFAFDDIAIYENPAHDVGVIAITAPHSGTCGAGTQETVSVKLKNYGAATQTSVPVTYRVNNGPLVTETFTGSIATNDTASYSFTTKANLSAGGTFVITAATALVADTFTVNNSLNDTINIFNPIAVLPHFQDFETAVMGEPGILPGGWKMTTGPGMWYPYQWQVHQGPSPFMNTGPEVDHTIGTAAGTYLLAEGVKGSQGDTTELITPCFNVSSLTTPGFSFWYHMAGSAMGQLEIQASPDNGATWNTLFTLAGQQQIAESDPWRKKVISLAGYTGNVKLKFKARHGNGAESDIALDDLRFFNIPPLDLEVATLQLPATGCGLSAAETVCATILNNGISAQTNFPVSYQVNGGTPVTETFTGTIAPGATAQYCFTTKANFSTPVTYSVTATANLTGDGDATNNTLSGSLSNLPVISTLPYFQDFENGNGGWVSGGANSTWALGTPNKTVINSTASGTKSWVTNLTGQYNNFENSYVMGPCFNFSALTGDPDIEMKIWWNAQDTRDGAVLQTSTNGGLTWQNVGEMGQGLNWYNDTMIYAQPGGQQFFVARGWTGTIADKGSKGWVTVRHKLNGMGGQASVQLRIAFASDPFVQEDGFAFDDIRIFDNTNNLAVTKFIPLTAGCDFTSNETVAVELENLGSTPIFNISMEYKLNNGTPVTATFAGPVAGESKSTFTFPAGANLTAAGPHQILVTATALNDPETANNSTTYDVVNALYTALPLAFDFETATTNLATLRLKTYSRSAIIEDAAASFNATGKGMLMDGVNDTTWAPPVGVIDPWVANPENFSAAYVCLDPATFNPADSLWLTFDLKQLYKDAAANTNFRVTVNGTQIGTTFRPPFSGGPAVWRKVKVDLTSYKNLGNIQVGLESNVKEEYANGTGTANLIDNVQVSRSALLGRKPEALQRQITVYPNPSSGIFRITAPKGNYALEVLDLTGRTILKHHSSSPSAVIELTGNAKGVYLLKIVSEGSVATKRLVVE